MNMNAMKKYLFPALCALAVLLCFSVGGIVLGGILMGMITTIAIWMSIQRMPESWQRLMCKNKWTIIASDLVFMKLTAAIMMLLSGGVTVVAAIVTQMVLLGILIDNMQDKNEDNHGTVIVVHAEPSR